VTDDTNMRQAAALVARCGKVLRGQDPEIVSVALGELASIFFAGFPDYLRGQLLALHIELIRDLIPLSEREIFGAAGHPGNTKETLQ
jgi:hypothetical protein